MKQLTTTALAQAHNFLGEEARPLEGHLFAYHFAGAGRGGVLDALKHFQNEDGGFGHALEPDIRTPASSAIATSQAFYTLREVEAPAAEPLVARAVGYLVDSYDAAAAVWPALPPAAADSPHAFWWAYDSLAESFGGFVVNPRAALVGHLHHYQSLTPAGFLAPLTAAVVDHLNTLPDEMAMYDFYCYLGLATANNLDQATRRKILAKLRRIAPVLVSHDPDSWGEHGVQPLDLAPTPDAPLADLFDPELLQANLDFLIEQQQADGSWPPAWSWAAKDAKAWAAAEREWKGILTVKALTTLRAYGRLA